MHREQNQQGPHCEGREQWHHDARAGRMCGKPRTAYGKPGEGGHGCSQWPPGQGRAAMAQPRAEPYQKAEQQLKTGMMGNRLHVGLPISRTQPRALAFFFSSGLHPSFDNRSRWACASACHIFRILGLARVFALALVYNGRARRGFGPSGKSWHCAGHLGWLLWCWLRLPRNVCGLHECETRS
jgi:hypothetical protein